MTEALPEQFKWDSAAADRSSLRFDRRMTDRWPMEETATAFEVAGQGFGRTHALRTHDFSVEGLGALSDTPIVPGTSVSIGFSAPGYAARCGTIVRCLPCGDGYQVAICFERRLAA